VSKSGLGGFFCLCLFHLTHHIHLEVLLFIAAFFALILLMLDNLL